MQKYEVDEGRSIDGFMLLLAVLMQTIKLDIRSERNNVQSNDIVMFFAVANFYTAYQRCLLMKRKVRLSFYILRPPRARVFMVCEWNS